MPPISYPGISPWPQWQKILFRFLFIYILLSTAPWTWITFVPWLSKSMNWYSSIVDKLVFWANDHLFHDYTTLVMINGSGDTSYAWIQVKLYLWLAGIGTLVWSIFDWKRKSYNALGYWIRIIMRYFLIMNCFLYGVIKVFGLQMPFPSMSQLATPLGDFLPMRLSWMFVGYSSTYQAFSGWLEILAGTLLLWRRTAGIGALVAAGVFFHVMIMNISFDIPVKQFSIHLFAMCLILLVWDYKRILAFVFNRTAMPGNLYDIQYPRQWMRITWIGLKLLFIVFVIGQELKSDYKRSKEMTQLLEVKPIKPGYYEVHQFVWNGDTIPRTFSDSIRWDNVIFDYNGRGSIHTTDTLFWQRYRRGYFNYSLDSTNQQIAFSKSNWLQQKTNLFSLHFEIPDSNTIILAGIIRDDSLWTELKRVKRHYQLTEKQFHWLSEYNR